jgi:hypothetical protein
VPAPEGDLVEDEAPLELREEETSTRPTDPGLTTVSDVRRAGKLGSIDSAPGVTTTGSRRRPRRRFGDGIVTDRSLQDVILAYLERAGDPGGNRPT